MKNTKSSQLLQTFAGSALIIALFASTQANAIELTLRGAAGFPSNSYSFVKSPSPEAAADLTFGMFDLMQFGFTFDHNWLTYTAGGTGTTNFFGAMFRAKSFVGLFGDVQAGECTRDGSSDSFSFGIGAGYSTSLTYMTDWGIRVGYRSLPDNSTARTMVDVGLQLSFHIF